MIIMPALLSNKLIATTGEGEQHYLPAQTLENITLDMILNSARTAEEVPQLHPEDIAATPQIEHTVRSLEQAISDSTRNKTLKDII